MDQETTPVKCRDCGDPVEYDGDQYCDPCWARQCAIHKTALARAARDYTDPAWPDEI